MRKFIKTGLLFIAFMFVLSIINIQSSRAGYCEDLCVPKEGACCTARGQACPGFEAYKPIEPIKPTLE